MVIIPHLNMFKSNKDKCDIKLPRDSLLIKENEELVRRIKIYEKTIMLMANNDISIINKYLKEARRLEREK